MVIWKCLETPRPILADVACTSIPEIRSTRHIEESGASGTHTCNYLGLSLDVSNVQEGQDAKDVSFLTKL